MINNFDNNSLKQKSDLRLPIINITTASDSAFLSFQLAAATHTLNTVVNNNWDTLEVGLNVKRNVD